MRDGTLDGGEATAVQAAGLQLRDDGDYSDYDLRGVGGSSRFSFVLFISLASSFGAAGVAFGTCVSISSRVVWHAVLLRPYVIAITNVGC